MTQNNLVSFRVSEREGEEARERKRESERKREREREREIEKKRDRVGESAKALYISVFAYIQTIYIHIQTHSNLYIYCGFEHEMSFTTIFDHSE